TVGATNVFDVIVPGTAVTNCKPAPDIFLLAAQNLGVNPAECYVIEDSPKGIIAGYNAGMKCIGIPDVLQFDAETKALLTAEFSDLAEAIPFFESLL
ncbi:MAG: HAD-IA family hydrolase, partial [Clostridia bacterium]|nr:HAD-IA family hydrolase [Clostridia bacterium]